MKHFFTRYEEIKNIKKACAKRDWFMGTSGNLSIKVNEEPIQFLITASGKDKSVETTEDFLLVDLDGVSIWNKDARPSAETLLHQRIYEKTNAGCVLHVHTIANNLLSDFYASEGQITFSGWEIIKAFGLWEENAEVTVPIVHNHADIPTLTDACNLHFQGDSGAILIHNHGITVWASTAFEAKKQLEAYEFLFEAMLQKQRLAVK